MMFTCVHFDRHAVVALVLLLAVLAAQVGCEKQGENAKPNKKIEIATVNSGDSEGEWPNKTAVVPG